MFPIRDSIPTRRFPVVTCTLIVVNILLFLLQIMGGEAGFVHAVLTFGMVPANFSTPELGLFPYFTLISSQFLHGGWLHLIGNVWTLYIFGDNVEDRMGRVSFLLFYLLCGLIANGFHLFFNWGDITPTIGASGAIAGVLGAYMILLPKSKILMLIPIFYIPFFFRISAFFYLAYWFVIQWVSNLTPTEESNIAFWAHIGGFVGGLLLHRLFLERRYEEPDHYYSYKRYPRRPGPWE